MNLSQNLVSIRDDNRSTDLADVVQIRGDEVNLSFAVVNAAVERFLHIEAIMCSQRGGTL